MTLEQAQAALTIAQQEVISASAELQMANDSISSAVIARDEAQASYSAALAAWEATKVTISGTSTTSTQNVVQNGTFDSTAGWSNVIASNTVYGTGASPIIYNNTLKGSYTAGIYIQQTGTFPAPTRQVTFAVDVWNYDTNEGNRVANPDYYRIEFRTYDAAGNRLNYYNLEWSQWHDYWITRGATYTLAADAVRWDIGFRMADAGFWAGAFGPVMDNVRLIATMTQSTPDTYTYGQAETTAKDSAYQTLQATQATLDSAIATRNAAQIRYNNAIAEVQRLTQLVYDLTPRLAAPTNLSINTTEAGVELSWSAPVPNLSGVMPERYAVSWSTTNFTQNGWGIASLTTSITIPFEVLYSTAPQGSTFQFAIRSDNDTLALYSAQSNIVSLVTVAPPAPEPTQSPEPTASPQPTSSPEPTSTPTPQPQPTETAQPSPEPTPTAIPTPEPTPEPTVTPEPTPLPTPTPEPSPEPEPTPLPEPEPEPTPTTNPTKKPEPKPTVEPIPEETEKPEPEPSPEPPIIEPEPEPIVPEEPSEVVSELLNVAPENLSDAQVEQLVEAALATFETAEPGSEEYEAALDALMLAAQADDLELPEELAAIPLIGDVAGAALEAFNAVGNIGADMSPQVRETAEKTVIASVIAAQAAIAAVATSTSVAAASTRRI